MAWYTCRDGRNRQHLVLSESPVRLSPRATFYFLLQRSLLWILLGLWLAAMFGGILSSGSAVRGAALWPALLCVGALFALSALFCYLRARSYVIELGPDGIALAHGVLRTVHETLVYARIQDILITRSLLERLLGLATLVLQSASGTPGIIPALEVGDAGALRDEILKRAAR
jgi:membrane protein YdbS with pleckstrin-like domain